MAQLYLRALDCLFIASYDSQRYGGGILTRLQTGNFLAIRKSIIVVTEYRMTYLFNENKVRVSTH
jgi:hypothetical protein